MNASPQCSYEDSMVHCRVFSRIPGFCWNTEHIYARPGNGEADKTREVEILLTRFSSFVLPGEHSTQKAFYERMLVG